ncbi:MAG: hypothetical protein NUV41_10175 [Eubacteriales bacterium]|nr:hypothetical protein [Eubacteriales bacterium]
MDMVSDRGSTPLASTSIIPVHIDFKVKIDTVRVYYYFMNK